MQRKVKRIVEEVCKKHNVPAHIGFKVLKVPYRVLREETSAKYGTFDAREYPEVRIPFIGTFFTNANKLAEVQKAIEIKQQREQEENGKN